MRTNILLGAALAFSIVAAAHAEPTIADEQILAGSHLELGDAEHTVTAAVDISTGPAETIELNMTQGDFNLQDNAFSLTFTSEGAHSALQQSLLGQSFDHAGRAGNAVTAEITAPDGVSGTVGINAAAGAFNIQKNSAVIAVLPGLLARSFADIGQHAQSNISLHHDVINDVTAIITLDSVSGNVGINLASGVGNVQLNSATTALSF